MVCGFSQNESNAFHIWKPQDVSSRRNRERRLHRNTTAGSHTAGIIVSPCTCACFRASTGACTGRSASNYHGHQSLRHAARCYARYYTQPSSFTYS